MAGARKDVIAAVIAERRSRLLTKSDLISLFFRIVVITAVGYLIFTQVFLLRQVKGMDMFPAIKDGDLALVFRLQQEYVKDDVIAYQNKDGSHFGRIIAKEGDVVTMNDTGNLQVNGTTQSGEILYPTYAQEGIEYPYRVPEKCVFVLGDYRTKATDSRSYGPIPMEDVDGKLITVLRRRGL